MGRQSFAMQPGSHGKEKRRYNRRRTHGTCVEHPTSPPQLADLAFNIHGWALEDGLAADRSCFEVINAYKATMIKGGFEAKVSTLAAEEPTGPIYRQDLRFTARELDYGLAEKDKSICRYLVVGYTFQEDDPVFANNKNFARYSDNELVGERRPEERYVIRWDQIRTPVLIVTPLKKNIGTSVRLFGLIMPRSGLCQPVLITHERIFYRWEFRASIGAKHAQRNKNWNQVVIDKALELSTPLERQNSNSARRQSYLESENESDALYEEEEETHRAYGFVNVQDNHNDHGAYGSDFLGDQYSTPEHQDSGEGCIKQEYNSDDESPQGARAVPVAETPDSLDLALVLDELFEPKSQLYNMVNLEQPGPRMRTCVKVGLNDESRAILREIRSGRGSKVEEQARAVLIESTAPRQALPANDSRLASFFNVTEPVDEVCTMQMAQEIQTLWPAMTHLIDLSLFVRIKRAMQHSGETLTLMNAAEKFFESMLTVLRLYPRMSDQDLTLRYREALRTSMFLSSNTYAARLQAGTCMDADGLYLLILLRELYALHHKQKELVRSMWQMPSLVHVRTEHYLEINVSVHTPASILEILGNLRDGGPHKNGVEDILLWLERLRIHVRRAS